MAVAVKGTNTRPVEEKSEDLDKNRKGQPSSPSSPSTLSSTSSPSTPPTIPSTPGTGPACVEEEIPQKVKFYEKIRSVETWEDCRDACNADTRCDYFKWKVSTEWRLENNKKYHLSSWVTS